MNRKRPRFLAALIAAALVSMLAVTLVFRGENVVAGAGAGDDSQAVKKGSSTSNVYIVQMADDPVVAYAGGVPGLRATQPAAGEKINPNDQKVQRYVAYLAGKHDAALARIGGGAKVYDYAYSLNGFAAELTSKQAAAMKSVAGVVSVEQDALRRIDTSSTPDFLGLTAPGTGLWDQLGGVGSAGEDVIVGIIDTGIWPEHPSFSDQTDLADRPGSAGKRTRAYGPAPAAWHGSCQPGEQFSADDCNNKVIGARYYLGGFGHFGIVANDFKSPRDGDSHGSHTASTVAGNHGVQATGAAAPFGKISGMAPRARIAAYKVCWNGSAGGCASSDSVAAIDQAVADGVDVINFSISGTSTNFLDPVEVAFMFAAKGGVFVAASAGNSGPTAGTVAHPGPWLTTVAAGTHNRNGAGSVTLGNGVAYFGASVATAVTAPFIDSTAAGMAGADAVKLALCYGAADGAVVLDPAKVAGKIVACDRGTTPRVNKSLAVQQAGGVGMILLNTSVSSLNADFHFVPTVHLQSTDRAAVKAYAATAGAMATINAATLTYADPAPFTASFSSRGPLAASGGDLLKPDVIAPGQDILAAVSPATGAGRSFDLLSGTSMSSPHVAGLAALLKNLHPGWTPMMIKSALMTSAYDVLDSATTANKIFRQGAGHVRPNSAADPGLVYDAGFDDWRNFLKGQGLCNHCFGTSPTTAIDASDLNTASIAIGNLAGIQTVTRTVTNVGAVAATYSSAVTGMAGIATVVSPASLTLAPGASATFTVTFTAAGAALNAYTGGQLTWSDGAHNVRIPLVIRPVALAAPAQVTGAGGPINYNVTFGYTGAFSATPRGLIPAALTPGVVTDDPANSFAVGGAGVVAIPVTIAAGTTYARFSLFDADVNPGSDIDLYVYKAGVQVGSSGSGTSTEEVNLVNPAAGADYIVYVHGWQTAGGAPSPFKLHTWLLGAADAGNMTVTAPASAALGSTGAINLTFSGLTAGTKYLGSVAYGGTAGMPNPTIVRVDVP